MKTEKIQIFKPEEYHYTGNGTFIPTLKTYLHDDGEKRPAIIVCPGGAYRYTTPAEAHLPAMYFFHHDFQAFVLQYSVNVLNDTPLLDQPMHDLARAIRFIRKNSDFFHIDPDQVVILGFSAAGHLCASVSIYYEKIRDTDPSYNAISARPDLTLLGYPVITMKEFTHQGTKEALLGKSADTDAVEKYSLEDHVHEDMAPVFLFHTVTDEAVPAENSLLFVKALKAHHVPFALHLFSHGQHGLSAANEDWAHGHYPNDTFDALLSVKEILKKKEKGRKVQQETAYLDSIINKDRSQRTANHEVSAWMDLAMEFVKEQLSL